MKRSKDPASPCAGSASIESQVKKHRGDTSLSEEANKETDPHRLAQRQKQIDFGKNTEGYDRYSRLLPRLKRAKGDPQTPDITKKMSKRNFDGLVKAWRRKLHTWDEPNNAGDIIVDTQIKSLLQARFEKAATKATPTQAQAEDGSASDVQNQANAACSPRFSTGIYSSLGLDEQGDGDDAGPSSDPNPAMAPDARPVGVQDDYISDDDLL
jgi:hypothetical protein